MPNLGPDRLRQRGLFVLSFDTELAWGSFDNGGLARYRHHLGVYREIFQRLVGLLDSYEIPATWLFVGHLLLDRCERDSSGTTHRHVLRPRYHWYPYDWHHLDPASDIHRDPWWYGTDLLAILRAARVRHEVGTHTFSHVIADDPACSQEIFCSQLQTCAELHQEHGLPFHSIAFPRNRIAHLDCLPKFGITAYRGRESRWYSRRWPNTSGSGVLHILDRSIPVCPPTYELPSLVQGQLVNLPASMIFLSSDGFRKLIPDAVRIQQARAGLVRAGELGRLFHLWLHPANMASGVGTFNTLEAILATAVSLREQGRLDVLTMEAAAERIRDGMDNAADCDSERSKPDLLPAH